MKDQLYLLRPGFMNGPHGPLYCSDSVGVEGVLSFFPQLRTLLDVHYLEFPRPRAALVAALGEEHQSVPVLIVARGRDLKRGVPEPRGAKGERFFGDGKSIQEYLALQYDLPVPS